MNIFWDYQNQMLISSLNNFAQISSFNWVLRDRLQVNLYVLSPDVSTGVYVAGECPAGYVPRFGMRQTREGADLLSATAAWALVEVSGVKMYQGVINLADTALVAAIDGEPYLDTFVEFTLADVSDNQTSSTQTQARVYFDVNRNSAAESTHVLPFPWVQEFTDPVTGKKCLRFKNSDGETLHVMVPMGV